MTDLFDDDRASAWLDGELNPEEQAEFAALLESEPGRRDALAELDATRSLVRSLAPAVPEAGFLASLGTADEVVVDLNARRSQSNRRRSTALVAGLAAAAALVVAILVPGVNRARPALAADVQVHQAGLAASGDPVSGLAPLGAPTGLGR
ncbi:MAG: hypothetical protein JJE46_13270 [Acidimicrobiia bacterium]|nr:hypothetical protein [Acidimicrobiia bacterium]